MPELLFNYHAATSNFHAALSVFSPLACEKKFVPFDQKDKSIWVRDVFLYGGSALSLRVQYQVFIALAADKTFGLHALRVV